METQARVISLRPQDEYETLQAARARQETDELKAKYKNRAGIEGTISQGTRSFGLRRSRHIGLAKTHLQHLATAAAMNLTHVAVWPMGGKPKAQTRRLPLAALVPAT